MFEKKSDSKNHQFRDLFQKLQKFVRFDERTDKRPSNFLGDSLILILIFLKTMVIYNNQVYI